MPLNNCKLLAALVVLWATGAAAAQLNLLLNPSFEQPALPNGTALNIDGVIGEGWVEQNFTNYVVLITDGYTGGNVTWPNPTNGNQFLYLLQNRIHQDVALAAATPYRLTFDLGSIPSGGFSSRAIVDIREGGPAGASVFGGEVTLDGPPDTSFSPRTLEFTSFSAASYQLSIREPSGYATVIDNFVLTPVPEPSGGLMSVVVGIGVAGRCWYRRIGRSPA